MRRFSWKFFSSLASFKSRNLQRSPAMHSPSQNIYGENMAINFQVRALTTQRWANWLPQILFPEFLALPDKSLRRQSANVESPYQVRQIPFSVVESFEITKWSSELFEVRTLSSFDEQISFEIFWFFQPWRQNGDRHDVTSIQLREPASSQTSSL